MTIDEQKEAMRKTMRDSLMQQVQALLKFDGAAAFALQIPDTDVLILAGPQDRIQGYLSTPIPYGAAGAGLRSTTLEQAITAVRDLSPSASLDDAVAAIRALKGPK